MSKKWLEILTYGISLGLLLISLQFLQYKWLLVKQSSEWYIGLFALLFCITGIWAGIKWANSRKKTSPSINEPVYNKEIIARLGITPREMEVLTLMAMGHSNQEIADQLFVSLNTVKTHISNLLAKLDAERRTQAIQKAKNLGILA